MLAGMQFGVQTVVAEKPDVTTIAADRIHLGRGCVFRNENHAFDAQFPHRVGSRCGMITAGCRHAAGALLRTLQRHQAIRRTAQFE